MNMKNKLLGILLIVGLMGTSQKAQAITRLEGLNTAAVASVAIVAAVYTVKFSSWGAKKIRNLWNFFPTETKKAALSAGVALSVASLVRKSLKNTNFPDTGFLDFSGILTVDRDVVAEEQSSSTETTVEAAPGDQ